MKRFYPEAFSTTLEDGRTAFVDSTIIDKIKDWNFIFDGSTRKYSMRGYINVNFKQKPGLRLYTAQSWNFDWNDILLFLNNFGQKKKITDLPISFQNKIGTIIQNNFNNKLNELTNKDKNIIINE